MKAAAFAVAAVLLLHAGSAAFCTAPQSISGATQLRGRVAPAVYSASPSVARGMESGQAWTGLLKGLGVMGLLCAVTMQRTASSTARAAARPAIVPCKVTFAAPAAPVALPSAPVQEFCLFAMDDELPTYEAPSSVAAVLTPVPAAVPAVIMAAEQVPAIEPATQMGASTSPTMRAARMVAGARRSCSRPRPAGRAARAAARAQRRAVGAKLIARPEVFAYVPSHDSSKVRIKIQTGLSHSFRIRSERGRESKTPSASRCTSMTTDARIEEKYLGEHSFLECQDSSRMILWSFCLRGDPVQNL